MKACLLLLPLLYAAAAIQTSLGDLMRVGRAEPDLLALAAVAWLLAAEGPHAFLVAGAIGLGSLRAVAAAAGVDDVRVDRPDVVDVHLELAPGCR